MATNPAAALVRRPDWRVRLADYLAAVARRPFRPGTMDCGLFAAGAVEAMTAADLAAEWRGTYRTISAAREALRGAGFTDHVALVASMLPEVAPAYAQAGDIAALPGSDGGPALGVVQGASVYCLRPSGLALVGRLHIERAFTV